jgi:hypothetical protein
MKIALAMAGTEQSKTEQRRLSFPDLPTVSSRLSPASHITRVGSPWKHPTPNGIRWSTLDYRLVKERIRCRCACLSP